MKRVFILGLLFGFCLSSYSSIGHSAENVIKLDFANFMPPTARVSMAFEDYAKEVEKRANGRVKINYYPGGTLVSLPQTYDAVTKGIADMAQGSLSFLKGRFPLSEVLDLPMGVKTAVMQTKMANAWYKQFKPKELDDTKVLFLIAHGPGLIHTKKPVAKMEDLKGMKIRCSGGVNVSIAQALGAIPISIPMGDAYDALQKGVLEGAMGPYEILDAYKLAEVTTSTAESFLTAYTNTGYVVMNKAKWNSLPPDIQKIFNEVSDEYSGKTAAVWDNVDIEAKKYAASKGHKFIPISNEEQTRWAKTIAPLYDNYVKEQSAKGLPAAEALKFCRDFVKQNQK
jgi:TRAP-type transport system periplasmic protein